jgi:hypothetical protein
MRPSFWVDTERKAETHTYEDVRSWYDHEASALGKMIGASGLDHGEISSYCERLDKLTAVLEHMIGEYTDKDKQRDLCVLHMNVYFLAKFANETLLPLAVKSEEIKVEAVLTIPDPVEGRMHGGNSKHDGRMHGGTMMHGKEMATSHTHAHAHSHMRGDNGGGHSRDAHGRYK